MKDNMMNIKRKSDGQCFTFDFVSYGRGEWAINLIGVNGQRLDGAGKMHGDPVYNTERAARKAARETVDNLVKTEFGWVQTQ